MPGTVEDFMRRFGGGGAIDDREAEQYYDRFASTHPEPAKRPRKKGGAPWYGSGSRDDRAS